MIIVVAFACTTFLPSQPRRPAPGGRDPRRSAKKRREHVRGKAGGGWESDEEDKDEKETAELEEEEARLKEALAALQVDRRAASDRDE